MKLTTFNTETVETGPRGGNSKPVVRFSTGSTTFNGAAVEMLTLKPGSKISIHQDQEESGNFYLSVGDEKGFPLRQVSKESKDKSLAFNASVLSRDIMKAFDYPTDATSIKFRILPEPTEIKKVKYYLLGHLPKTE
ncbi:MAG: hypothetical protein JSS76_08280 [Bacteroidetes bacterium]|nr:hypothetical protein [Bacteroidota bacterium]